MTPTNAATIELLILTGCSRCGKRFVYPDHRLPCTIDAPFGTPTAVHCNTCADIVEAERCGQEACVAGQPMAAFWFETEAEFEAFSDAYQRTRVLMKQAKRPGWLGWVLSWFKRQWPSWGRPDTRRA